jgi:membrane protein YqaA with SNARE-associated domain
MGLTAGRFTLRRARAAHAGEHAKDERKNGKTTHLISFLPPAPEVLTILTTWLTPTPLRRSGKHIDFQAFRGFLRAGGR